jgi:hypothetical protein
MRFSTLDEIMRYPPGTQTGRPAEVVSGVPFNYYDLGTGIYVWRTADLRLEVGNMGAGYYGKVDYRILEQAFNSLHTAMRRCVAIQALLDSGEIQTPPPPPVVTPQGPPVTAPHA